MFGVAGLQYRKVVEPNAFAQPSPLVAVKAVQLFFVPEPLEEFVRPVQQLVQFDDQEFETDKHAVASVLMLCYARFHRRLDDETNVPKIRLCYS